MSENTWETAGVGERRTSEYCVFLREEDDVSCGKSSEESPDTLKQTEDLNNKRLQLGKQQE